MKRNLLNRIAFLLLIFSITILSCKKDKPIQPVTEDPVIPEVPVTPEVPFDINNITDTYENLVPFSKVYQWGPYNVHDPSVLKIGEYFYAYSTDAMFGLSMQRSAVQIRKSKDLVDWKFVGWAFNGLPKLASDYITANGGTPFDGVWAPYIMKYNNEYRLYYSLSSAVPKLSAIGLAVSTNPEGPWTERGLVVTSKDNIKMTNAIDPTVLTDNSGAQYMYYGSAWEGIYRLELEPSTGLAKTGGYKGDRIAARGWTGNKVNGNIEGPEIIYNEKLSKYYLFISYDWLETKYNVRVGRSDSPTGPFYDFNGKDINIAEDHGPMILAPYFFQGHQGWQGTGHCSVFRDGDQFYMAHQGRPVVNKYYMVLHVRKMFWTEDGWPVVSPERYAATEQTEVKKEELTGIWEYISLGYLVVPGYSAEQILPDLQGAVTLTLAADGTFNGNSANQWSYTGNTITLKWSSGKTDKAIVERGRDWENKKACLIFSGLNNEGTAVWGKK